MSTNRYQNFRDSIQTPDEYKEFLESMSDEDLREFAAKELRCEVTPEAIDDGWPIAELIEEYENAGRSRGLFD